jgi:hypothetical protein
MNTMNGTRGKDQPEQIGKPEMQSEQGEIKVIVFSVIRDPVVQQ